MIKKVKEVKEVVAAKESSVEAWALLLTSLTSREILTYR